MKVVTVVAIAAALYILIKYGRAGTVPASVPAQAAPAGNFALPMESMNCAIPINTDYLPLGARIPFVPPTSVLGQRFTKALPLDAQQGSCAFIGPVNNPVPNVCAGGVPCGGRATIGTVCNPIIQNYCCLTA